MLLKDALHPLAKRLALRPPAPDVWKLDAWWQVRQWRDLRRWDLEKPVKELHGHRREDPLPVVALVHAREPMEKMHPLGLFCLDGMDALFLSLHLTMA